MICHLEFNNLDKAFQLLSKFKNGAIHVIKRCECHRVVSNWEEKQTFHSIKGSLPTQQISTRASQVQLHLWGGEMVRISHTRDVSGLRK